jgi:cell division protein FtsQ
LRDKKKNIRNNIVKKKNSKGLFNGIRYFIFVIFPVIAVVLLVYFGSIAVKSVLHINKIVFTGNEHLTDEELKNLAGLKGTDNLAEISSSRVFSRMMESPWIRDVSIRKELPDRLHILIKEAEPFALLDIKGRLFIVDDKGKMLEELKDSPIPFLPVISGDPFGKKEVYLQALDLARVIKEKGLLSNSDYLEIIANRLQDISVNIDGVIVKVGAGDYEDKLLRFTDIEEEIKKRNIHIDYIDLRFANKAVVKPVNEVVN